jgi:ferredoxin-NADP reductase
VPAEWRGKVGVINGETVQREIPDYATRTFYLSGSHPMVSRMHAVLRGMGVGRGRVRKDYFDGLVDSDVPLPRVSAHGSLAALKPWGERRRSLAPLKAPENAGRNP